MVEKITKTDTTFSVPRRISPKTGNTMYLNWQNLLDSEMSGSDISGVYCSVLALIEEKTSVFDSEGGTKFTFSGLNNKDMLGHSLCYTIAKLYPEKWRKETFGSFINNQLIPSGYEIVTESNYMEICDIFLSVLEL